MHNYPPHRLILDVLVAAVLLTILGLTSSFFIQALVDVVFILGRTPALNWLGLGIPLVTLARAGFLGLRSCLLTHLSRRIDAEPVHGYHCRLLGLPLTFVSTITACAMLWLNWSLTVRSLALIPAFATFGWLTNKQMKACQRIAAEQAAEFQAHASEIARAAHVIRAFRAERRLRRPNVACTELQLLAICSATISSLAVGLSSGSLLWFGSHQVLAGTLSVGRLMSFHVMLGTILASIDHLGTRDVYVPAPEPGMPTERPDALDVTINGSIEFQDVSFRYGTRDPVFVHVNIQIRAGECVGIVGESGCGKTTLVNLLARFLDPASGRVLIDGTDVRDYTVDSLRRGVAFVPQDIVLLSGTIADNIRLGRPTATRSEIRAAAKAARIGAFIDRLPHGYDTQIGERGLFLCGGERQRIALARAVLMNPSILILDEPIQHIDSDSELAVQSILDQRRGHRTTIVISHRPLHVGRVIDICGRKPCMA